MFTSRCIVLVGISLVLLFLLRAKHASATDAEPPAQPETGPGGKEYSHKAAKQSSYGKGGDQFWIFEPDQPTPATAPVIVFCHGWSAMEPNSYGPWIEHLVRRGNVVIYPRYQASVLTPPNTFTPNAVAAIKSALAELAAGGHVKPELDHVATVGHSFGGVICANLAALSGKNGLPKFKAAMPVEPGSGKGGPGSYLDYAEIPADTLLLCVAGDEDKLTADTDAKRFLKESTHVPKANKNLIVVASDRHGKPALSANHFFPSALGTGSPLQTYGLWKWFDALTDAAFYGKNRQYALGDTPEQRFMGRWSDGTPVAEPNVTVEP